MSREVKTVDGNTVVVTGDPELTATVGGNYILVTGE